MASSGKRFGGNGHAKFVRLPSAPEADADKTIGLAAGTLLRLEAGANGLDEEAPAGDIHDMALGTNYAKASPGD